MKFQAARFLKNSVWHYGTKYFNKQKFSFEDGGSQKKNF